MDIYKVRKFGDAVEGNRYPGRGIVGRTVLRWHQSGHRIFYYGTVRQFKKPCIR